MDFPGSSPTVSSPMSVVAGVRPIATRTASPTTSLPSSSSTVVGPSPSRRTSVTPVPSRTSTPSRPSDSATSSPANGSSRSSSPCPRTTRVTDEPSIAQAVASSQPTTPPPSTTSRGGTSFALVPSRLVQGRASRRPGIGGTLAVVPVATTTACRAVSRSGPSPPSTATALTPVSRPCPRITSTPAPCAQSTWPASLQWEVNWSRRSRTRVASRSPVTAAPAPGRSRTCASTSPSRSSALLGMHAQ